MVKTDTDEVNLLDLLASFFSTLKRNLLWSIALPVTGVAAGLFFYFSSSDVWESSVLIETSLLSPQEGEFLFAQLEKVKVLPGLTEADHKKIRKLSFKVIMADTRENGLNERGVYLQATARVRKKEIFPKLQKTLLEIISTSPPVVRHRSERSLYYDQLIKKIDEEILAMDRIKSQVPGQTQATYLNPALLYAQTVDLFREKMSLQIKKQEIETVHLIKGFDTLSFDRKTPLVIMVVAGLICGCLLLAVVLFVRFFFSYFRDYQTTH